MKFEKYYEELKQLDVGKVLKMNFIIQLIDLFIKVQKTKKVFNIEFNFY